MIRPAPGSIPGRCIFALLTACGSKIFGLACVVLLAVWGNDVGEVDWEEGSWIRASSAGLQGIETGFGFLIGFGEGGGREGWWRCFLLGAFQVLVSIGTPLPLDTQGHGGCSETEGCLADRHPYKWEVEQNRQKRTISNILLETL
jgi:hypothetical protein